MQLKEITGGGKKSGMWTMHKVCNLIRTENPLESSLEYEFLAYCPAYNKERAGKEEDVFPKFSTRKLFPLIDGIFLAVEAYLKNADEIGLEAEVETQSEIPEAYKITFRITDEDKLRSKISGHANPLADILDEEASLLADAGDIIDKAYLKEYLSYCRQVGLSID